MGTVVAILTAVKHVSMTFLSTLASLLIASIVNWESCQGEIFNSTRSPRAYGRRSKRSSLHSPSSKLGGHQPDNPPTHNYVILLYDHLNLSAGGIISYNASHGCEKWLKYTSARRCPFRPKVDHLNFKPETRISDLGLDEVMVKLKDTALVLGRNYLHAA